MGKAPHSQYVLLLSGHGPTGTKCAWAPISSSAENAWPRCDWHFGPAKMLRPWCVPYMRTVEASRAREWCPDARNGGSMSSNLDYVQLAIAIATAVAAFCALVAILVQVRMLKMQDATQRQMAAQQDAAQYLRQYHTIEFEGSHKPDQVERDLKLSFLLLTVRQVTGAYPDDAGWTAILKDYLQFYADDLRRWKNDPKVGAKLLGAYGAATLALVQDTIEGRK
jgi:hypothetical protein